MMRKYRMGREIPPFLKDFLSMRQQLHKNQSVVPTVSAPIPAKKGKGTADQSIDDLMGLSVAKIIEEKPPKKEVMGYFQKQCDRLTKEKMK
jgi:hypothetical protein